MARPTVITDFVVKKLEEAFALGCTDEEACIYADICKQTLYNFQEKNQEFLDRKQLLKNTPVLEARKAVVNSFKQNPHIAFKYLEKKKDGEFSGLAPVRLPTPIMGGLSIHFDKAFDSEHRKKANEAINRYLEHKS